jgi:tetratricopeptide (TPR) repeat protein
VWSVAIVLFEMLTGKPYFEAEASSKLEWIIRNYRKLQPAIDGIPPGLREILSRGLDPDLSRRFASAATMQAALHQWRDLAPGAATAPLDPDATRRTAYTPSEDRTRRTAPASSPPKTAPRIADVRRRVSQAGVIAAVALFLLAVFTVVYQVRMFRNADALGRKIDSGQLTTEQGAAAYRALANRSLFSFPLHWVRNSLRDRYIADADRVLADYREASESTPVYSKDWKRAQAALASATAIAPDDKSIRGRAKLVDGFIGFRAGDMKRARADFEEARGILNHSPDPHLGLSLIYLADNDLDQAENEMEEAERNNFRRGRRELRSLADGYRKRGERWLAQARRAHDLGQLQGALQHAEDDLDKAQKLYISVAPAMNGVELAERVSAERDKAMRLLAEADRAKPVSEVKSELKSEVKDAP